MENLVKQLTLFLLLLASPLKSKKYEAISIIAENGGHKGVTSSLCAGLDQLNIPYHFNKMSPTDCMIVLAGIPYLKEAIALKKNGKIRTLLAGPNIVIRSDEYQGVLASPEIDVCVVPSDWVRIAYEEETPALIGRIKTWFAGVDHNYWQPNNAIRKQDIILVYWKTESVSFCLEVESIIRRQGYQPIRIAYGHYTREEYKRLLNQAICAVFISISESQGIALAEAWSMDVPTLVWNPEALTAHGRVYSMVSSAPYLCDQTGAFWKTFSQLDLLLERLPTLLINYHPRSWVLNHLTHSHSAQALLAIINS